MSVRRRLAAMAVLAGVVVSLVLVAIGLVQNAGRLVLALVSVALVVAGGWYMVTRRRLARAVGTAVCLLALAALAWLLLSEKYHSLVLLLILVVLAGSGVAARFALGRDDAALKRLPKAGTPVPPARRGVLIMNPRSGGGKAERFALAEEARRRGIVPITLGAGDDLSQVAKDAIAGGADVIGVAGGDGSQALVASVAASGGAALVCVPAGTRNHFAVDLGLDRDDVVGALDAFGEAVERRIDLARVGDRVFVNNVSLGMYADIVHSPGYREAKLRTVAKRLPDLLGKEAGPSDLRFSDPDGAERTGAQIIQISNNPYRLSGIGGLGSRARLDTGMLGIVAGETGAPGLEWTAPSFEVRSSEQIEAGIDGEAAVLDPPLEFRSLPGALRVRIPRDAPGLSPAAAAPSSLWWAVVALGRAAVGRATVDEGSGR